MREKLTVREREGRERERKEKNNSDDYYSRQKNKTEALHTNSSVLAINTSCTTVKKKK